MNKLTICIAVVFLAATSAAQQNERLDPTLNAVKAYADGNRSYLLFSNDSYKPEKKYTVIKIWNDAEPLTATEKEDLASLKAALSRKNVEVVDFQWKNETNLKETMKKYNLSAEVKNGQCININGGHFNLNTTSGKALFVLEDGKPLSLCSGYNCEDRLKYFFAIRAYN